MATPDDLAKENALARSGAAPQTAAEADAIKPAMGGLWTIPYNSWSVDPRFLNQIRLNDDKILALEGYAPDLTLYDGLLDDDKAFSTFQQRRLDVISKNWEVEAGGEDSASKKAADHLRENLKRIGWDAVCDKMLYSRWYGYGVAEPMWEIDEDGLLAMSNIYVPNRAWFCFTNGGELRLRTVDNPEGEAVPDRKFWTITSGGSHDDQLYGVGLAHWCYWPIYFKRNVTKFWALFLEKFGMPTIVGKFPPGWESDPQKLNDLLSALAAVGTDAAVAIPQEAEVEALEGSRSGSGASSYKEFIDVMDAAITGVILTQTMTSTAGSAGLGSKQAEVHEGKGLAVSQSDSDLLAESFNNSIAKWMTEWNFPGAKPPRVYRKLEDDEDINTVADRDTKLDALGWVRTEESVKETYGEGYERKPEPKPLPGLPGAGGQPQAQNDNRQQRDPRAMAFAAQFSARDPQPLYISRKLLNADALLAHMRKQGFTNLDDAAELHVTQLYCRTPVDWFALASEASWTPEKIDIDAGGPRAVEPLGDKGVIVLQFANWELESRHRWLVEAGATHSFPNYWPHVTFARDAAGVDLETVEPYRGELHFGPEIWEELQDGELVLNVPAVHFAAAELDAIDRIALAMSAQGTAAIQAMVAPVREALAGMNAQSDPEALRVAMLQALETMDTAQFAAVLADPLVAVRAAEESGLGADSVA